MPWRKFWEKSFHHCWSQPSSTDCWFRINFDIFDVCRFVEATVHSYTLKQPASGDPCYSRLCIQTEKLEAWWFRTAILRGNDVWLCCNTQEHVCCEGKNLRNKLCTRICWDEFRTIQIVIRKSAEPAKARKHMGSEQSNTKTLTSHRSLLGDVQVFQLSFHLCSFTGGVI